MSGWTFEEIREICGGRWVVEPGADARAPEGASFDTRDLGRGQMFAAFKGANVDGHDYLSAAARKGAALALVSDGARVPEGYGVATLEVDDVLGALTALAVVWRSKLGARVIGVTGSNGKTTTTRLIAAALERSMRVHAPKKSYNNALGVPVSILNAPEDADVVVQEIGMSTPGEIAARCALVKPDVSVITSIGRAHLAELGSIEGIAREKGSILAHTGALGIVTGESAELDRVLDSMELTCAIDRVTGEDVRVVESGARRVVFEVRGDRFKVPIPGAHNARNAAMAVLAARAVGGGDGAIREGLGRARLPEMRLDRVEVPTSGAPIVVYNDAYNANPDSVRAALAFFGSLDVPGRRVAVLGDMLELGDSSEREHLALLGELTGGAGIAGGTGGGGIDRYVLVGPAMERAHVHVGGGSKRFESIGSIGDSALTSVARSIREGDTVLLKGSRGVALERLVYMLINQHTSRAGRSLRIDPVTNAPMDECGVPDDS